VKIQDYSFGRIVVDGKEYRHDLLLLPEGEIEQWWRKEGHLLQWEDLAEVVEAKPEILVIGQGYAGAMQLNPGLAERLAEEGIEALPCFTTQACEDFNRLSQEKRTAAALHLTC
jgi:hypothetical protein